MANRIGVRRETKGPWERRSPLVPQAIRRLTRDRGLEVVVEPSARRVFPDKEFVRAGAIVSDDLSTAQVVLGMLLTFAVTVAICDDDSGPCLFGDGFDSGATSAWSNATP